jgi:hypothetical protein
MLASGVKTGPILRVSRRASRGSCTPLPDATQRTMDAMAEETKPPAWTREEAEREERAQRARVRRDAARGVTRNLEEAVAHTEFARRFAEAFEHHRRT